MTARPRPLADLPEQQALALADAYTLLDPMPAAVVEDCRSLGALLDTATAGPVVYTVALPAGLRLLNANERLHWRTRNDLTQAIVDAAIVMTRQAKIPRLERVGIKAVLHPADNRRRDPHNWYPSIKAAIDGVVRSGRVLPDDDAKHVVDVSVAAGEPVKGGQLVLLITPLVGGPR